ncbi:MAG TPA: hypothetical protein VGI43_11640 [Mucilaginibacter sp.]
MKKKIKPLICCLIYVVGIQKGFSQSGGEYFLNNLLPGTNYIHSSGWENNILLTKSRILLGIRRSNEFWTVNRFQGDTFLITINNIFSTDHKKAA